MTQYREIEKCTESHPNWSRSDCHYWSSEQHSQVHHRTRGPWASKQHSLIHHIAENVFWKVVEDASDGGVGFAGAWLFQLVAVSCFLCNSWPKQSFQFDLEAANGGGKCFLSSSRAIEETKKWGLVQLVVDCSVSFSLWYWVIVSN